MSGRDADADLDVEELATRAAHGEHPQHAQDATQEILIRIVTHLAGFDRSRFTVRIGCPSAMLLCRPRPQRAAYLLADVVGPADVEGAAILDCSREELRRRVSPAHRSVRYVLEHHCGLSGPAHLCRRSRQIASLSDPSREQVEVWSGPAARQLDGVAAIGDLNRFDRFAAPDELWTDLQQRNPEPLGSG